MVTDSERRGTKLFGHDNEADDEEDANKFQELASCLCCSRTVKY